LRAEKKKTFSLSVGASSLLIFFVILTLTTFATLSLVSANADYNLSLKAVSAADIFYAADAAAEEKLALIDAELGKAAGENLTGEAYYTRGLELVAALSGVETSMENDTPVIRYIIPVTEGQELRVALTLNDPAAAQRYTCTMWKVVNTADWDLEDGELNLWLGDTD
jgi:hypothetical protein